MLTNRLTLIVVLVVIAGLALFTVSMVASPRPSASLSAADRAYDQIELQRARRYTASVDYSYNQIELQRAHNYAAQAAHQAYLDQRHGEQTMAAAVDFQASSQSFRQAEQAAFLADARRASQAYLDYRRGEWSGK